MSAPDPPEVVPTRPGGVVCSSYLYSVRILVGDVSYQQQRQASV